jgi:hypothetical protein
MDGAEIRQEGALSDPFRYLDAKVAEFQDARARAKYALRPYGWTLRPNHPISGLWRARRWIRKGCTEQLRAATADELVKLAKEDHERRQMIAEVQG